MTVSYISLCDACGERLPRHTAGCREARSIKAADVVGANVEWLWPERVARGVVTVIAGVPGVGKSTLNYDLAARISREGRTVLVATAEDHLAAVVRPRLEAAGADLDLVRLVTVPIDLPDDVDELRGMVEDYSTSLVIVDPLVAFIGDSVNTHRDHHVRRVLAPLGDLAEDTSTAVVVVIHTNKGQSTDPLMRISGSIGFTGAARSVLVAAEDPKDETRRILAVVKSNLAKIPHPLAYRLVQAEAGEVTTSRVEWLGEAPEVDVRDLLAVPERGSERTKAKDYLRSVNVFEMARPAKDLEVEATAMGINIRTLRRAREDLGIHAWRDGFGGAWWWGPKGEDVEDTHRGQPTHPELSPTDLPAPMATVIPIGDIEDTPGGGAS